MWFDEREWLETTREELLIERVDNPLTENLHVLMMAPRLANRGHPSP
ncbi:MAG: hypothetical protein WCO26_20190 [Deltaproteobacteria bacterium]